MTLLPIYLRKQNRIMKFVFIFISCFLTFTLSAQTLPPVNTLPDTLFTGFALRQTHEKPIYLDVQAGDKSGDIVVLLKNAMLANGYQLKDEADSTSNILQVKLDQSEELMEIKKLWGYKRYQIPKSRYSLQLLNHEKEILTFTHYEQFGQPFLLSEGYTGKMKWYDPIMLFAIIGSLVYIIWTTN
jgi:hypothetical protein